MQTLYHYTNVEAFFAIVKHKKLWLSCAHNMNDHQEINWTNRKVAGVLRRLEEKYGQEHTRKLWELMQMNRSVPYICSLSTEADLLSQWRAYGKDGTGFSIGFNGDLMPKSNRLPLMTLVKKDAITTLPVVYTEKEQDKIIEAIITNCMEAMQNQADGKVDAEINAAIALNGLSTIFKNQAFHEEREWRIVHTPMIMGSYETNKTTVHAGISEPQHRVSNNKIVTYFEFDFSGLIDDNFVCDLVLGPKCEVSNYDLDMFLSINGLHKIKYRRSSASYR